MSLVQLTLRPPPHVDFVSGFPGIPPNGTDRPQAAVKGAIEVRVPFQGVKAQYVKVELRKVETLPGGGAGNTFYDLIGPGTVTLWTSGGAEYEVLHAQDFPFSIRIPESVPPSLQLDQRAGVHYELVATVCTKGKRGFFRRRKNTVTTTSASVIIDKHDLHSTWPVYGQSEKRHVIKDGVKLTVERNQSCYGPGDRISVTASIWSDNVHTIMLRSFEILLKETISFRGHMFVAGKKGEPMTRAATISENVYQVNTPMYRGMQTTQDLFCILSATHTNTTLSAARHIDINYVLVVKALMGAGTPLIIELPVIVSNWQKSVSLAAMRRIGPAPGLSRLPIPGPGATDSQTITRVEPIPNRTPSSDHLNRPTTAETLGHSHNRQGAFNTHPMTPSAGAARTDDPFATSSRRPTHQPSSSQGSAKSGLGIDESGNWPRPAGTKPGTGAGKRPPSAGSIPSQTPRFTITNALPLEIPEEPQSLQHQRDGLGSNKGPWLSATEEKQMLYERARARVGIVQGIATQSPSPAPPPQAGPQSHNGPWPSAEEEKLKLFHSAQAAVARAHGYSSAPPTADPVQAPSGSKPQSAAAVMYSQAMSARNDAAKQAHPPPVISKATLPSLTMSSEIKIPGYLTAEEEKAALRRYEEAKRAVDRIQHSGMFEDTPGGSGSGPISYNSLYPSPSSGSTAQSMSPPLPIDLPPPFEAGPPLTAPQQLSDKERLRRAYEAQDAAALSRQGSTTVPPPPLGSTAPPPFGGGSAAYTSAASEKEMLRRRFEAQDAAANNPPSSVPPQTPPRNGSILSNSTLPRNGSILSNSTLPRNGSILSDSTLPRNGSTSSTLRSRPAPLPPPVADGSGQRVLTAAEEKALLKSKYEAQDATAASAGDGPPMYLNGHLPSAASAGSSSSAPHPTLSHVSSIIASPPPLKPRPPQEYIKETQEEDARLARLAMNGVVSTSPPPGNLQHDEEKTKMGHTVSRKGTATSASVAAAPFDRPLLPLKPLGE